MKTTLEISDAIYRRVKSKSSLAGRPVREVTQRLYELWLAGNIVLDDPTRTPAEGHAAWAKKWLRETETLSNQIEKNCVDPRLGRELLKDDRR